jgi:AcrR family transcriptional regulator
MSEASRGSRRRPASPRAGTAAAVAKRPSTKKVLIETGERLFGHHGFDGISLREIAVAAGQANTNVVQYHFKDKSGLVRAILEDRVDHLEAERSKLLEALKDGSPGRARELLKILWLPTMSIRSTDGSHTFCRFLLQYRLQAHLAEHPVSARYDATATAGEWRSGLSIAARAAQLLKASYDKLPEAVFYRRLSALSLMFLASVVEYDNARLRDRSSVPPEFDEEPILDMSIAALGAAA